MLRRANAGWKGHRSRVVRAWMNGLACLWASVFVTANAAPSWPGASTGPLATSLPTVALVAGPQAAVDFGALVRCRMVLADLEWSYRIWPEADSRILPIESDPLRSTEP